jgi:hypothetical protein
VLLPNQDVRTNYRRIRNSPMFTAIISRTLRPIIELEQRQPKLGTSSALPY